MDFLRKKPLPVAEEQSAASGPVWPEPGLPMEAATETPLEEPPKAGWFARAWAWCMGLLDSRMYNLYSGLVIGFLTCYAFADYTSFMAGEQRPGQLVFSNTMTQLWTACFRMTFVLGFSLGLLRLVWPELFQFFRTDVTTDPDLTKTIRFELTSFQRLCVFLAAFFGFCYLFILLLSVNLPTGVSVGR